MTRHSLVRRLILAIFLRSCQAREAAPLITNRRYFNNTIVYHTRPFITVLETIEITRSPIEIFARFHYTLPTTGFPPKTASPLCPCFSDKDSDSPALTLSLCLSLTELCTD